MAEMSSADDSQVRVLAEFIRELQAASDPSAVVDDYRTRFPEMAGEFSPLAAMEKGVKAACPADPLPPPRRLAPGQRLGDYEIVRLIAAGGMGEVYEARQARLDRTVAVKVIRRGWALPEARERFLREQQVLARLHQTHIVPIHAAGEDGEVEYFAMAFIDGAPLHHVIQTAYEWETTRPGGATPSLREFARPTATPPSEPRVSPQTALARDMSRRLKTSGAYSRSVAEVMAQAAEAVQHAHDAGVYHRDIKPSNLMVDRDGQCWIIDFGLAGHLKRPAGESSAVSAGDGLLTQGPMGTPQYMAPEQYEGKPEARSDIWALGATLYELLTLRRAFEGSTQAAVAEKVLRGEPADARELAPSVPRDLAAICRKALHKKPEDRYSTPGGLASDLHQWLNCKPTIARPAWRTMRPLRLWAWRHKSLAAAVFLFGLLLCGSTVWAVQRAEDRKAELDRIEKQHRFEQALLESQRIRLGTPYVGWVKESLGWLEEARKIRPDADLRDYVAATLAGLDVRHVFRAPGANLAGIVGLSGVAFGPDGRLLTGGWMTTWQNEVKCSPALLWGANQAPNPVASIEPGDGPVAFPDADSPLHLILPARDRWNLLLWNVGTNTKVAEFPLPGEDAENVTAALSADARFVAGSVVASQPDGKRLGNTFLWSSDRRKPEAVVKEVGRWEGYSSAIAFSPDGKYMATGTESGKVTIRATADGAVVRELSEVALPVTALGFGRNFWRTGGDKPRPAGDPAGWLLAVGSKGGDLAVWNLATTRRVNPFHGSRWDVHAIAFSPDGTTLASAGRNMPILWDVATGRRVIELWIPPTPALWTLMKGIAFSPDGRRIAVSSAGAHNLPFGLDVFELDDDRGIRSYRGLNGSVAKVWLSPSRKFVAALAENWQLAVWDRESGRVVHVWDVPVGWFADNSALAFDEKRGDILFASGEWASRWNIKSGQRENSWRLPLGLSDTLAVPHDGKPILVRREQTHPQTWSDPPPRMVWRCRELGEEMATVRYHLSDVTRGSDQNYLSSDGKYLLLNERQDQGNTPRLFHATTGKEISFRHNLPFTGPMDVHLSERGATLVASTKQEPTRTVLLRLPDLTPVGEHGFGLPVDDEGKVGVKFAGRGISLYRIGEDQPLVTFDLGRPLSDVDRISGDGRFVGWGRADGTVCVADVNRCLEQLTPFPRP